MARKYTSPQAKAKQLSLDSGCTALYIRVSTERQADEGFSLDAQKDKLIAYCHAHSWLVCAEHVYVDAGISGKSTDRPAFQSMLQAAKTGEIRRIVSMKLDRIARNVKDFLTTVDQLKEYECALVLVKESFDTSTPHGKFALTMFAAMAELEAATITERVMSGKTQKASAGGYNGSRVPMGYKYDGETFTVAQAQAATVRRIFEMFITGHSLQSIARKFNEAGIPTATGKGEWRAYGISHILRNGFYAGIAQWDGVEVEIKPEASWPIIITRAEYDEAQRLIGSRKPGQRVDLTGD